MLRSWLCTASNRRSRKLLRQALLSAVVFALAACGFQLRTWELAGDYETIGLATTGTQPIAASLERALRQTGVRYVSAAEDPEILVELLDSREDLRTATVGVNARTAEFELTTGVNFAIKSAEGKVLSQPRWAQARRVYQLDRGNLVGSSEEQTLLRREMHSDLVQQVMRALSAITRQQKAP